MKKVIRLTEDDLTELVKRVIQEQKKSAFMTLLDDSRGLQGGPGVMVGAIEECLKKNGFPIPDSAPQEFKWIVIKTSLFNPDRKSLGDFSNTKDVRTFKILNCMKQNDYYGYFEK